MKRTRYSLRVFSYSALRLFPVEQLNYKEIHNRCGEKPDEALSPNGHTTYRLEIMGEEHCDCERSAEGDGLYHGC